MVRVVSWLRIVTVEVRKTVCERLLKLLEVAYRLLVILDLHFL
jgi:hypothetical protein